MAENTTENNLNTTRGTLLAVDGHSLAFRAFFALPVDNFSTESGQATNAVWGFATMLSQVIDAERPDRLAVAFDVKGGTFRNRMLPQYKGTREAAPEELLTQLPLIQEMLAAMGVTYIEKPGYEGDDVIGTLATMGEAAGYHTLVLSGDRDAFQLVDDNVTVLYPGHHFKDLKRMTPAAVFDKYKVTPAQYPDLAALRGETADNIPGVPGVGDGFAAKWINQYGGLDGIIAHADEIGGKKGEALRANLEQIRLNRRVNALVRDVDLGVTVDDLAFGHVDAARVDDLFARLEFGSRTRARILRSFNGGELPKAAGKTEPAAGQENGLAAATPQRIDDAAALEAWAGRWMPEADATPSGTRNDPDATAATAATAPDAPGLAIDADLACADALARRWTLDATGSAKPGQARLETLVLAANGHAAVLRAPLDPALAKATQRLIDTHAGTMTVHGAKEHMHLLAAAGLTMPLPMLDTKLAGYLVQPDFHADDLTHAAAHFLDIHLDEEPEATQGQLDLGDGAAGDEAADEPDGRREATRAAIVDALAAAFGPTLDERRQYGLLKDLELPVSRVLGDMERQGAQVDATRLAAMRDGFAADAEQAQRIAWDAAGDRINLQSPRQLAKVLFEDMGLKPTKRTKSGSYTTNAAALQELYLRASGDERAGDFLGAVLRHRETNKLKQIVQTLIDATNPADQRIHTTFEQTVAATGRLSSVDPNLQNIPNRNAAGREIRAAFVPGEGYTALMSCDYSQVELRIMAHLSGDEALIEAFRSGADFHRYVASLVYGIPVDQISADQRSHVKAMSYGLAYGLSTYGLAQQLRIAPREAEVLKAQYFATFGKVHDFLESCVADARRKGYTETMFGRRRYFPGLKSPNRATREAAERGALNAPIQGTAADIMKIAMVRAEAALRREGLASRIILQIHDELVVEVAPGEEHAVTAAITDAMEHAVTLAVPLDVSSGIGADWQLAAH
ncbi:DNA polymerase I [Bifidobacterium pullorum subsp. saeculare]|uniref:DNA polymerase I n=1 Tax=Bifidobacterium pullorum subsp. saeculare TaxID=78257 RepID=A0A938WY92_9BIFI|nr:DNA polymerase I [Bifidobacterium pullorum]MBM6699464.1 DNA polymerase I [Bifidobacterium pullorum subsp. saeculare]